MIDTTISNKKNGEKSFARNIKMYTKGRDNKNE